MQGAEVVTTRDIAGAPTVDGAKLRQTLEYYARQGWTDGLPVVPVTDSYLQEFLAGTSRDPDEVLLTMPHLNRQCTVTLAAINAAMAGCRPEYFPVVLAAWDAFAREPLPVRGIWALGGQTERPDASLRPCLVMPTSFAFHDVTVIALDDGEGPFFEPREVAFPGASASQWERADREDPGAVRDGAWWLRIRSFAIRLPSGQLIIVDTGIGSASAPARGWAPVPGRLPVELAAAGIAAEDVDIVVLTHMHTDHVGWSMDEAGDVFFPRARFLLQRAEIEAIDTRAPALSEWLLAPLRATGQLSQVDGDESLGEGLRCVATPGHTPGHQSVLLERGDDTVVFTGDLLVHMLQLIDPDVGYKHEDDQDRARVSRTALLTGLAQRSRTTLAAPHLGEPFLDPGPWLVRPR